MMGEMVICNKNRINYPTPQLDPEGKVFLKVFAADDFFDSFHTPGRAKTWRRCRAVLDARAD